jgi:hypothetical protein
VPWPPERLPEALKSAFRIASNPSEAAGWR